MSNIRNLIFEGGGVKGLAYLGFLLKLNAQKNYLEDVQSVGGASAGALLALMLALNYSLPEIEEIYKNLNFNKFKDDDIGIIRDISRLVREFGYYKGNELFLFIKYLIKAKTNKENITFRELKDLQKKRKYKDLYVISTKLFYIDQTTSYDTVIFSYEHTPQTPIAYAVRSSMAIPFYFTSIHLKKISDGSYIPDDKEGDVFVDGGLTNNYPIRIFDKIKYSLDEIDPIKDPESYMFNESTLGVRLDSKHEIDRLRDHKEEKNTQKIKDFTHFASAVLHAAMSAQDEYLLNSRDISRSVFIDCGKVSATDFDLDEKSKQKLIDAGASAATEYLAKQQPQSPTIMHSTSEFKLFTSSPISSTKKEEPLKKQERTNRSYCCHIL